MEKIITIKQPVQPQPFLSLAVPKVPSTEASWVEDLLIKKGEDLRQSHTSISQYMTQLVVADMLERKLITKTQASMYRDYVKSKFSKKKKAKESISTRLKFNNRKTFCLYLIRAEGFEWLLEVMSSDYISKNVGFKTRSTYIWDLFVTDNLKYLSSEQRKEWQTHVSKIENRTKQTEAA